MNELFPAWLRIHHYVNFLFITLLIRSGIQILMEHPRLYFNDHCTPGSEWLKFTRKSVPTDRLYTSHDDAIATPHWLGLPGGPHRWFGMALDWHFLSVIFWIGNGLIYVGLLFLTGQWHRLIPTSWSIFPDAVATLRDYLSFRMPPEAAFHPYDALQQLAYASTVFLVSPLTIVTGAAMSPALAARYPWYSRLFGGRQGARSIHFLCLVGYLVFLVGHVTMVVVTGFARNMNRIVFGTSDMDLLGIWAGLVAIGLILAVNIVATRVSLSRPRLVQNVTGVLVDGVTRPLLDRMTSRQCYTKDDISPYFWVNGRMPTATEWIGLYENGFKDYRLEVSGLVEHPMQLSLDEIKAMGKQSQITKHNCIQGWSGIAEWGGLPLDKLLKHCRPLPNARYVVFRSFGEGSEGGLYYDTLDLTHAKHPQTLLAYEMNGHPLPLAHGAPLRLRIETKLGFKMVKWIKTIEFVEDFRHLGEGRGGYDEDKVNFGWYAEI